VTFQFPFAFLLLLLLPLLVYLKLKSRGRGHFYPSFSALPSERTLRERLVYLPEIFFLAALVFLIIALSRPQKGFSEIRKVTNGIAVEIVMDRSGSMGAQVNQSQNRLDVVKELFSEFVKGRPDDMIGLVSFARYADTNAPLTLAHDVLPGFIKSINLVTTEAEDGTAIGDALALAAARLHTAGEEEGYSIKSRVVILLTDGVNNVGQRTPEEAADLAKEWGIKVYTIGFTDQSVLGQLFGTGGYAVDEETLRSIADRTGGSSYTATDGKSLQAVFDQIDSMEKTEVESYSFRQYREFYLPFALAGFISLFLYILLSATLFRRLEV